MKELINRERYVISRKQGNEIEYFCGLARHYDFKTVEEIGNSSIKTYMTQNKALSAYMSSWWNAKTEDVEILRVNERVEILEDDEKRQG